jgi:hypothetical protein
MELPNLISVIQVNLIFFCISILLFLFVWVVIRNRYFGIGTYLFLVCFFSGAFTWMYYYITFWEATTYSPGFRSIHKFIANLSAKISVVIYLILLVILSIYRWISKK